jgi:hypothetical protein
MFATLKHAFYTRNAASSEHTWSWQQRNVAAPCTEQLFNTTRQHWLDVKKNSLLTALFNYANPIVACSKMPDTTS